ncbi:hypothetical protein WA1_30285 [Scytonema hofmannii PCC 7110]|uniref:DUF1574 domain-containing protein n=1 Tax=Scytonema hofmannii PCC 7110 TaxID=128403 RepID=A0A139X4T9_9CYAN|nr:DUF1574 family protein [Scytonema hofmannii]KYC39632.1 hypothetical protein WA1_30285 [Scytonema hofmannii PCC 7110]
MKKLLPVSQQSLLQWVSQATGISTFGVKIRLQGNDLHILCEGPECPQKWQTLSDLLKALQQTDVDVLTSAEQPAIYQVLVYGRRKGEKKPEWCHRVHLNQLDRHLEQVHQSLLQDAEKSGIKKPAAVNAGGALIVSNESLARQGQPDAIARYLSETMSAFGVSVEVKVIQQKATGQTEQKESRLWVFCESSYSPDPSLIGEPIAQKLRHLKLSGYKDAVIASRVSGEPALDWLLRVDLTPSEVMLREWARWGDIQAISMLLNEALAEVKVAVKATLKETTLHIFCTPAFDPLGTAVIPEQALCLEKIKFLLHDIAPQGIVAAAIYGRKTAKDNKPAWVDWSTLPATENSNFAASALELATAGDEPALVFLLERLLNPDLDLRLKTGGLRVLPRRKEDLLHVMCDAPVCPARKQVASKIAQFVHQLKIPGVVGIRIYGRRAGNKEPFWNYGVDFEERQRLVPEATPEFAATSAYVGELLPATDREPVLRPDLTLEEVQTFVAEVARDWSTSVRQFLIGTQLFADKDQFQEESADSQGIRVALVWGVLGLILTLQSDWVLGRIIARNTPPTPSVAGVAPANSRISKNNGNEQGESAIFFANTSKEKPSRRNEGFNSSGFIQPSDDDRDNSIETAPLKQRANATAILLAARSQMPSFNARQLDEQLVLYKHRLQKKGSPPDVLIIGSSRALRGIDPEALSQALKKEGFSGVDVFNFGINGATAQVVDFILRQVLERSQLPKLILWADGSRAFNSGREDMTFKTIAASPGYRLVLEKAHLKNHGSEITDKQPRETTNIAKKESSIGYKAVDEWLNQGIGNLSASYQQRDRLKQLLNQQLKSLPGLNISSVSTSTKLKKTDDPEENLQQAVDFDGFLPLSIRFQPSKYYSKHPKVLGSYDNDYKSFSFKGEQETALRSILEFTEAHKISLVFVNMPLTTEYLDSMRSKHEKEFQNYMLSLAGHPNFTYRDLSQLWPKANNFFSDPSHLNRYGAYEVSKKLAKDAMIPWPTQ